MITIDWYKLTDGTEFEGADIRLADTVLDRFGIQHEDIQAYQEDSEDGSWMLAVR